MLIYYLVIIFAAATGTGKRIAVRQVEGDEEICETPEGKKGVCGRLSRCQPIYSKLNEGKPTPEYLDFLQRSSCRIENGIAIICCPVTTNASATISPTSSSLAKARFNVENKTTTAVPSTTTASAIASELLKDVLITEISSHPEPNHLLPQKCGELTHDTIKIVGGREAIKGSWPWLAAIGYSAIRGRVDFLCGGSIISNQHILTAAHCVYRRFDLAVVRLGAHNLSDSSETSFEEFKIKKRIIHEEYNHRNVENDIAILKLSTPIEFKAHIRPICLPREAFFFDKSFAGYDGYIAGWGKVQFEGPESPVLKEAVVPILSNDECQKTYRERFPSVVFNNKRICAGLGDNDTCQGDSGGPLMIANLESKLNVIGIVSQGYKCGERQYPGIYTRVAPFMEWIETKLQLT